MKRTIYLLALLTFMLFATEASAHVEINYPEGGETFRAGDTITILWTEVQSHVTLNWEIHFSPDAGGTWTLVSNSIAVPAREFDWVVPSIETEKGRIRVVQNNDEEQDYQDVSANFTIETTQAVAAYHGPVSRFDIFPNPASDHVNISFVLDKTTGVEIAISDVNGNQRALHTYPTLSAGRHDIRFDISRMPQGACLLTLRSEGAILTRRIVVSR